ncbi:MAG: hypothetical protein WCX97_03450 [Candidatus Magasanikbacteria bacterium]
MEFQELRTQLEKENIKMNFKKKFEDLLRNCSDLNKFAEILNAEEYLTFIKSAKVWRFDAKSFINNVLKNREVFSLPEDVTFVNDTFLPPGEGEMIKGEGESIKKEIIPRTKYLIDLLSEMNLKYEVIGGVVSPQMLRSRGYYLFFLPTINKAVLVNNFEYEATRVIHNCKSKDEAIEFSGKNKKDLDAFPNVEFVSYNSQESWAAQMQSSLDQVVFEKLKPEFINDSSSEVWQTASSLMKMHIINISSRSIKKAAESFRTEHPDWFKLGMAGPHMAEYYSPQLIDELKKLFSEKTSAPEGWLTAKKIYKLHIIKSDARNIKKVVESYRQEHPEWFKHYTSGPCFTEHYSPELIQELIKYFSGREFAPEGWRTNSDLYHSKDITIHNYRVKNKAEEYRREHPEWFHYYLAKTVYTEYYSPELVKVLIEWADSLSRNKKRK